MLKKGYTSSMWAVVDVTLANIVSKTMDVATART
jgi:hypothetical protein